MKEIPVYHRSKLAGYTKVDDEDYEVLSRFKWRIIQNAGRTYIQAHPIYLHRFITNAPDGVSVDHSDGDRWNNTKQNLRFCTLSENSSNQKISTRNTSGFKGVSWDKRHGKWRTQLSKQRKLVFNAYFDDKVEAAKAYNAAAQKYHGKYARLNPI